MSYMPSSAQLFHVTVPTRTAAEELAGALAARGHRLVAIREVDHFHKDPTNFWYGKPSMRSDEAGQWDVFSVATGPHPDDDTSWWEGQEEHAVRQLNNGYGGRSSRAGGGGTETVLRSFTRVGLVHDLDDHQVQQRRLSALASSPPRAGGQEARSVDEDLPDFEGGPIALVGLDAVPWPGLDDAYGSAAEVPALLAGLAANDSKWELLHDEFVGSVLHQGTNYSSSAPALVLLAQLAKAPELSPKRRLDLLYTLFLSGCESAKAEAYGYRPGAYDADVQSAVTLAAPELIHLWPTVSRPERRMLLLLAALSGAPAPNHEFDDPASRLATSILRDDAEAELLLADLAKEQRGPHRTS